VNYLALATTLILIGENGGMTSIPFRSHEACRQAICKMVTHKTCEQILNNAENEFKTWHAAWSHNRDVIAEWAKTHPCTYEVTSGEGGAEPVWRTADGTCPVPPDLVTQTSFMPKLFVALPNDKEPVVGDYIAINPLAIGVSHISCVDQ
jgi:hypothetical protein